MNTIITPIVLPQPLVGVQTDLLGSFAPEAGLVPGAHDLVPKSEVVRRLIEHALIVDVRRPAGRFSGIDGALIGVLHLHVPPIGRVSALDQSMNGVEPVLQDEFEGPLQPLVSGDAFDLVVVPFRPQQLVDLVPGLDGARLLVRFHGVLVRGAPGIEPIGERSVRPLIGEKLVEPGAEVRGGVEIPGGRDDGGGVPNPYLRVSGTGGEAVHAPRPSLEGDFVVFQRDADELHERVELGNARFDLRVRSCVERKLVTVLRPFPLP